MSSYLALTDSPGRRRRWNFVPGKSAVTADPVKLVTRARTGQPLNATEIGAPGFRERVDFGEVIGEHVDQQTGVGSATTKGIIHHSKKGVHVVSARP
jgi:filamentous hemagglutinin